MPGLDAETERIVAGHWRAANAERRLFNGRVFSADAVTPDEIAGHWTEFRRATAQMRDPSLSKVLQIRNLAVCGMLVCPDGVAIARREPTASYQPGVWQLPPAGSVDFGAATPGGADWRHALFAELREELGIEAEEVRRLSPLCLVQHPSGVLDMGVRIDTDLSAEAILSRHRALGNEEYQQLQVLPPDRIEAMAAAAGGELMPTAPAFLRLYSSSG